MKILHETPDSVLWLLKSTEKAQKNLHRYTREAGIDPSRVIFAPFLPEAAHLERLTHADLFLDSFPCNAHTTASDALWAGVPLLTRSGQTFASRVAGSILTSVGAEELIVTNDEDYFKLATRINKDKEYLKHLKQIVKSGIGEGPLYDIKKYTRSFENALLQAQSQYLNADSKKDIFVRKSI
jgi:predicted O-linked N-acetylglucosamine transferase (SPINDLY family)